MAPQARLAVRSPFMEPEAHPPAVRIADADRERAAELLQRATGEGRLTLEEFTVRVGAVWAADTSVELTEATAGLAPPAVVGNTIVDEKIVNGFSWCKRLGRWKVRRALRLTNVFGSCKLDLREAAVGAEAMDTHVIEIAGKNIFGEVEVIVPEGIEVELTGSCIF